VSRRVVHRVVAVLRSVMLGHGLQHDRVDGVGSVQHAVWRRHEDPHATIPNGPCTRRGVWAVRADGAVQHEVVLERMRFEVIHTQVTAYRY
jgi:hypothetical protein